VIHHEDVRRPNGVARTDVPDLVMILPWLLRYNAGRLRGVRLRLIDDDGRDWRLGAGSPVVVTGHLLDLVLWLSGRHAAAEVEVEAEAQVLATLRRRLPI
jgi:hypothetical protein